MDQKYTPKPRVWLQNYLKCSKARLRQKETAGQTLVALLFFSDLSAYGWREARGLGREFYEALERAAATKRLARIIRFPKAYQAMDESEMVLDGLVESDPRAWQRAADLYVWGTYSNGA